MSAMRVRGTFLYHKFDRFELGDMYTYGIRLELISDGKMDTSINALF